MRIPEEEWKSLSHRQRRALVNKERRRRKRQAAALKREEERAALESQPGYLERVAAEEKLREVQRQKEEAQRLLDHEVWLERERVAQEEFRIKREKEEKARREKEEREKLIREEWEALQKKEKEEKEKKEKLRREKEVKRTCHQSLLLPYDQERLKEALATANKAPSAEKPTHNPLAPEDYTEPTNTKNYGTEKDKMNCPFFLKTGACRFGETCSRVHPRPTSSSTLLIPGMYSSLGLSRSVSDDRDDAALEYEEGDMYKQFRSFYDDVFPEFASVGKIIQFKVSCNYEPHLRGNVYVQYSREEECEAAFRKFNGRWYAQRQLSCQFCPVQRWRHAICGLYSQKRCPKGKHCNFLHVFRNPGGAFSKSDRDIFSPSPPPSATPSSRRSSWSRRRDDSRSRSRSRERHTRSRRYSTDNIETHSIRRSREERSISHNIKSKRRSKSRDRRSASHDRRSRSHDRHSRSHDRHSRSRDRNQESTERKRRRRSNVDRHHSNSPKRYGKRGSSDSGTEREKEESNSHDDNSDEAFGSDDKESSDTHKRKKKKKKKRSHHSRSPLPSARYRNNKHKKKKKKRRNRSCSTEKDAEVAGEDDKMEISMQHEKGEAKVIEEYEQVTTSVIESETRQRECDSVTNSNSAITITIANSHSNPLT